MIGQLFKTVEEQVAQDFTGIDADIQPALFQLPEMYPLEFKEEGAIKHSTTAKDFALFKQNESKNKKNVVTTDPKSKKNKVEQVVIDQNSTKRNWRKLKGHLRNYVRMKNLFEGNYDQANGFKQEDEKYKCMALLMHPESSKRKIFEHFISFIVIMDIFVNIFSLCFDTDTNIFNTVLMMFYLLEVYV